MNLALWQSRFGEYLKLRNSGERTIECYTGELKPFFAFLEGLDIESLGQIRREDIEEYRNHLYHCLHRGRRIAASTQAYRLAAVKAFMRYLARERFILFDPASAVEVPRLPRTLPRAPLSVREAAQLIECCTGNSPLELRNRAILEVLYSTALRNSELRLLTLETVELQQRRLRVLGKGRKMRMVPLGEQAMAALRAYLDRGRPHLSRAKDQRALFLTQRGSAMQRAPLARLVSGLARRAGIKKTVTPHLLRNCCLTHMLKNGAELRHLQELAGHESPETTQRYTRVEVTDLRRVLERCHPRERKRS